MREYDEWRSDARGLGYILEELLVWWSFAEEYSSIAILNDEIAEVDLIRFSFENLFEF